MRPLTPCVAILLLAASASAQSPAPSPRTAAVETSGAADTLPVRRVVLYKAGIGYFEHLGNVRDRQDVTVRFTSAQLNDVLKSLTTIDLGNGQITAVSYNSIAPMDQRLGALRLPLGAGATTVNLLAALRGARIEAGAGGALVTGRLLGVERQTRTQNGEGTSVDVFSLVTDAGEVRAFDLTPSVRVRILDADLRQEIGRYLDVVGSAREQDVRQMVISTSGTGERPLFVSYISEVPIWKTTYRLVLRGGGAKPLLQGWAIVDNTIGEDWSNVELSLVAGAPQSFIQNISQPYYGRRPTVPLPQRAVLTPQTHDAAVHVRELRDVSGGVSESVRVASEAAAAQRPGGIPPGTIGGMVGGIPGAPPPPPPAQAASARGAYDYLAGQIARADGGALGDLFEYRITQPVTLRKNQSALVPIVHAEVTAEKVAIWNRGAGSGRPLRAIWVTNSSGLTLDGGSIAVIDGNAFAGEGLVEPLKPGERRLVSYAADQGVLVDATVDGAPGRVVRVRARDGIVIRDTEERASWTYVARNEDAEPVTLVIEHPRRPGWTLAAGQSPAETTPQAHRFRVVLDPRKETMLVVREIRPGETRIALGDAPETQLAALLVPGESPEALQRALAPLVGRRTELAGIERQLATLEQQRETIMQDQQRLRENLKALRGTSEERPLVQRYTRQLAEQENALDALRGQIADAIRRRETTRDELAALIARFSFDSE